MNRYEQDDKSVTVYVDPRVESTDGVHTYEGIHEVKLSHAGDLALRGEDNETIAYYAAGRWSGFHKKISERTESKTITSTGLHLHFSGHVHGISEEEFAKQVTRKRRLRKSAEEFNNDDFD